MTMRIHAAVGRHRRTGKTRHLEQTPGLQHRLKQSFRGLSPPFSGLNGSAQAPGQTQLSRLRHQLPHQEHQGPQLTCPVSSSPLLPRYRSLSLQPILLIQRPVDPERQSLHPVPPNLELARREETMTECNNPHRHWETFAALPLDQGGAGRHRCAGCAYEQGIADGLARKEHLELALDLLPASQAGSVRHRSPHAAYALGYYHGVARSYEGNAPERG